MIVKNPWVGYLDRSFQQIKSSILIRLGETIPEISDHSDSNILVIAIEFFAGISEQLNYYIDNMAREAFITTSRRYSSVVKHTRLIDYRIKAMVPATLDITLEFKTLVGIPLVLTTTKIVPSGILFSTPNGIQFITIQDTLVPIGVSSIDVQAQQKVPVVGDILGITNGNSEQALSLGKNYVHNSVELTIGTEPWLLVNTLGFSGPLDKHFIVDISANKEAYIRFGDGINGIIPEAGLTAVVNYYTSRGILGNINSKTLTTVTPDLDLAIGLPRVDFYNSFKAIGGTEYEDIERIRRSAPLSLRTLDRSVSHQDHIDIALLCPGVDKADVLFECGKFINVYIAPNGGGIANKTFLDTVEKYFETRKIVGTFIKPLPCGESQIMLDIIVTGRFRIDGPKLRIDVLNLILDKYSYNNSDINKAVRVSDIISLVDNYVNVDYLKLNSIYLKPYIRPIGLVQETIALSYSITLNTGSITKLSWRIQYDGAYMVLFKGNIPIANMVIGIPYTDPQNILTITINAAAYVTGMEWDFKTLPINDDLIIDDYSVPVIIEDNITLIVNEQLSI